METIAIVNQKGGVAKTTTIVNLGVGLAKHGKAVLLVDIDPQGSMTSHLGYEPGELKATTATLMQKVVETSPLHREKVCCTTAVCRRQRVKRKHATVHCL